MIEHLKKDRYSYYLSIFRVSIVLITLRNIYVRLPFFNTLYKGEGLIPYQTNIHGYWAIDILLELSRQYAEIFLIIYVVVLLAFLLGIGNRYIAFTCFLLTYIDQDLCYIVLNGGDNLLKFSFLYLSFANSFRHLTANNLTVDKSKILSTTDNSINNLVVLSIQLHLCLAYLLSTIYKIHADVWFNGIATYYILLSERFNGSIINNFIASNGLLVTVTTYMTLVIEGAFPFLIWFKQTKSIMLLATTLLHIGIFWTMMIQDFQVIFLLMHPFFYTNKKIQSLLKRANLAAHRLWIRTSSLIKTS